MELVQKKIGVWAHERPPEIIEYIERRVREDAMKRPTYDTRIADYLQRRIAEFSRRKANASDHI